MTYKPSLSQKIFHDLRIREALYAGSAGPGKTTALYADPVITQLPIAHAKWLRTGVKSTGWAIFFRREYPMLAQTILKAQLLYRAVDPGGRWSQDEYTFIFSCGYRIQFAHMAKPDDWKTYDSQDYTAIYFDELIQFTKEQYDRMRSRCRTDDPDLRPVLRVRSATNPEAGWVKKYFVDPAPLGNTVIKSRVRREDGTYEIRERVFLPALLRDNPDEEFKRDYEITLADLPAHIRLARLNGRWDVIQGAFFAEEFIPSVHVVKPFPIPSGWRSCAFRVLDWGYKTWAVVTWWVSDTDGCLICYRERNYHKKDARFVAKDIKRIEQANGEWNDRGRCSKLTGPADTQIWEERGQTGPTIAEDFMAEGVYWERCSKGRATAATQMITRLKDIPETPVDGVYGRPGISWFDCCVKSVQTIPIIKTSEKDPEAPEDGGDDHWLDNAFYACMYRPMIPKEDELPKPSLDEWPSDELASKRKNHTMGAYGVRTG